MDTDRCAGPRTGAQGNCSQLKSMCGEIWTILQLVLQCFNPLCGGFKAYYLILFNVNAGKAPNVSVK